MRKSGGIVALIAGLLGFIAAVFTLVVGGIGSNFNADAGDTIIDLGWSGILICFLIIVLGAIAMNAKTFIPGILIIVSSIFGAIYGGTLVAVLMILALVGGVLACMSNGNVEIVEASIEEPKSKADSLIVVVALAGLILMGILYASKPNEQINDAPIDITLPDNTKLTHEPQTVDSPAEAEAAEALSIDTPAMAEAEETPLDTALQNGTEISSEAPSSESAPETTLPATAESQVIDMSFNDLYLDYNNLVGKKVKVNGHFLPYGDLGSLSESAISATTLYVNVSGLSRENRKLLLDNCASGCNVELEGVVGSVQFLKGITVTALYKITTN